MPDSGRPLSFEEKVTQLWDLREIESLLNHYCRAFDRRDIDAAKACYWPGALDDHPGFCGEAAGMCDQADDVHVTRFASTQHYITNNEIELQGNVAHTESYFMMAASLKDSFDMLLVGGRYLRRIEKREGVWRIAATVCVIDWGSDDTVVRDLVSVSSQSTRGKEDWVYHRPLTVTRPPFNHHVLLDNAAS